MKKQLLVLLLALFLLPSAANPASNPEYRSGNFIGIIGDIDSHTLPGTLPYSNNDDWRPSMERPIGQFEHLAKEQRRDRDRDKKKDKKKDKNGKHDSDSDDRDSDSGRHSSDSGDSDSGDSDSSDSDSDSGGIPDTTPPIISATVAPSANGAGWHNTDVTVTFDCIDTESGIASCTAPVTVTTDGSGQVITGTALDNAGNSASTSVTLNVDKTAPAVTIASPTASTPVNTPPAEVSGTVSETLSGLVGVSCNGVPATLTGSSFSCAPAFTEGSNTVAVVATDVAGNNGTANLALVLDTTPPVITPSSVPAPNGAGWNNTDVTVSFDCSDTGSGIASCTSPINVTTEDAGQLVNGTAQDNAGNTANTTASLRIDKTPPGITVDSPAEGDSFPSGTVTVSGTSNDALSGVANITCNGALALPAGSNYSCEVALAVGGIPVTVQATDVAGNSNQSMINLVGLDVIAPVVMITSPANLALFSTSPQNVLGTVDDDTASVTVNGVSAPVTGGSFAVIVPLDEGNNVLAAVAEDAAANVGTASIQVTLDTTPPVLTIDSPADGFTTNATTISIIGMINDIVPGTVNAAQANVTVNGAPAMVSNRSYLATDVPLVQGDNIITAEGADQAGNQASASIIVTSEPVMGTKMIRLISGNNQIAAIETTLAEPLIVELVELPGLPVPNKTVIFKVVHNNGTLSAPSAVASTPRSVAVTTDAQGRAAVDWTLGNRAGSGNNRVEASAVGFSGSALFNASGLPGVQSLIVVDSGNAQTGVVSEPLPRPFVAIATDSGSNRLPDIPIVFYVTKGSGNFDGELNTTVTTDSDGRAVTNFTLGPDEGNEGNIVEATIVGNPTLAVSFVATGYIPVDPANTRVSGIVLDNTDNPIPGVTLHLEDTALTVQADAQGQFVLQPAPVGNVHLKVDGTTTSRPGTWPKLAFEMTTVSGQDNSLGMPIYMLPLDVASGIFVDETTGGTVTVTDIPGFALTVAPGSATFPDGSRSGTVSVTLVHADKVPMVPNFGQQPRFIVTIQPAGTLFVPPAKLTVPNTNGLQPGEITELHSFDHDLGQFVAIGTGSVSEDGSVIVSDPGVGVVKAGWHCDCGRPPPGGCCCSASVCTTCVACGSRQFVFDDTINPPGPCNKCLAGVVFPDDSERPKDDVRDCNTPVCESGEVVMIVNLDDAPKDTLGDCIKNGCGKKFTDPDGDGVFDRVTGNPNTSPDDDPPIDPVLTDCLKPFCSGPIGTTPRGGADNPESGMLQPAGFQPKDPLLDCFVPVCDGGSANPSMVELPEGTDLTSLSPTFEGSCLKVICERNAEGVLEDTNYVDDTNEPKDLIKNCLTTRCNGGLFKIEFNDDDKPTPIPNDCKEFRCTAGELSTFPDSGDIDNEKGDCLVNRCFGDIPERGVVDDTDVPDDTPFDCKRDICSNGVAGIEPDLFDEPQDPTEGDCQRLVCHPTFFTPIPFVDLDDFPEDTVKFDCRTPRCVGPVPAIEGSLAAVNDADEPEDPDKSDCKVQKCRDGELKTLTHADGFRPDVENERTCNALVCRAGVVTEVYDPSNTSVPVPNNCRDETQCILLPFGGGLGTTAVDDDDKPENFPFDCVTRSCKGGEIIVEPDLTEPGCS